MPYYYNGRKERGKVAQQKMQFTHTLIDMKRCKKVLHCRAHTSAKLIEIQIKFLQPKHSPHGAVRQMESNETPHTPWGLRHL